MTTAGGIGAVIVTYHCGQPVIPRLEAVLPQVNKIYIVDNASDGDTTQYLASFAKQHPDTCHLQLNSENAGLAAAQNQGIRKALGDGMEWVLLLDDDSLPDTTMVAQMLDAAQREGFCGIVAPCIVERNVDRPTRYLIAQHWRFRWHVLTPGEIRRDVTLVIASGSLIHRSVFERAGLMADGWFIDAVDHEFCLRALSNGIGIVTVGAAMLEHSVGKKQARDYAGMELVASNHSAQRRYYMYRNRIFLMRRYGQRYPFLYSFTLLACSLDLLRIVLMETGKSAKLKAAFSGLIQGLSQPVPQAPMA